MTLATIPSALILDRFKGRFNDENGAVVDYWQLRIQDQDTRDLIVIGAKDAEVLKPFEPGKVYKNLEVDITGNKNIRAAAGRLAGAAGSNLERF